MAISKAQQASVNKYVKSNYDRINVTMPKGRKDIIKAHAESQGESVNGFITRAIDNQMEQDKKGGLKDECKKDFERTHHGLYAPVSCSDIFRFGGGNR